MQKACVTPQRVSVVLPSLNPTDSFDRVVDALTKAGFAEIVLVDDGSREACKSHFRRAAERYPQCHVLTHEVNRGKGAALRTAFDYLLRECPDCAVAVTADGDGQHLTKDILRCAVTAAQDGAMVLGCRNFSLSEVPARSRMGNRITSAVFRLFCGIRISDTQTGLRAFPRALFPRLLEIRGDRYDYETNVLLELHRDGVAFREIPIETVYEDGNSESHFRPFLDSLRIYRFLLLYILSSLTGALTDLVVFYFARRLLDAALEDAAAVAVSTVIARAISSLLNFNLNRSVVFHGQECYRKTLLRYYALCIPQMLLSMGLVALLAGLAGSGATLLTTLIKFAVDVFLFFLSFRIQQTWVFKRSPRI